MVVQYRSAAALGAVGRPSEILVLLKRTRVGRGLRGPVEDFDVA